MRAFDMFAGALPSFELGDVEHDGVEFADGAQLFLVRHARDHRRALGFEPGCRGVADTGAGARHQRHFAFEPVHGLFAPPALSASGF